jgi:hypothetical protein
MKHPIAVIFGAGATRGGLTEQFNIVPPVDSDFFDIAGQISDKGTGILAGKVLRSVWDLYRKTHGIGLEYYYRDIDTRHILQKFAKPKNQPVDWKSKETDLIELIRRVYIHTTCDLQGASYVPRASEVHRAILGLLGQKDAIITFNYDLLIEESFSKTKYWNPVSGYGVEVSGKEHRWCRKWMQEHFTGRRNTKRGLKLLKLHGSINWEQYESNRRVRMKNNTYEVMTRKNTIRYSKISLLPPSWQKDINVYPYSQLWRQAGNILQNCRSLIILGYSLPETDLMAHALLAESVRRRLSKKKLKKSYLKEVHLADPNPKVRERFINLFTPAMGATGQVFQYSDIKEFAKRQCGLRDA